MLMGQPQQAFPEQDHEAHIEAHMSLLSLPMVQEAPPVMAGLHSHILQHIGMAARERVDREMKSLAEESTMQQVDQMKVSMEEQGQQLQLMVQTGAIDPATAQQMAQQQQQQMQQQMQPPEQFAPEQVESRVAQVEVELIKALMPMMTAGTEEEDPLVGIRMQELSIKEMEAQHKLAIDQAKLELDGMKIEQRAVTDAARLELQEQVADDRSDVNRERIDVQRQAMEQRNANQTGE